MATRTFRDKKQLTKLILSFDFIFMSTLTWITKKAVEPEIKNKGDQFRWRITRKFYSGGADFVAVPFSITRLYILFE